MKKAKIDLLIVDDEEQFLECISKSLELRDFHVVAVNRGEKAIAAARQQDFDVALVDLKMPGMSGEETLRLLKEEHKWMEVVILTGHGAIDTAVECTRIGAHSYLQKPCELAKLIEALQGAYKTKVMKRNRIEAQKMDELLRISTSSSPREVLRRLRELDESDD